MSSFKKSTEKILERHLKANQHHLVRIFSALQGTLFSSSTVLKEALAGHS